MAPRLPAPLSPCEFFCAPLMRGDARTLAARDLMLGGRLELGVRFFWSTLSSVCVFLMLLVSRLMFGSGCWAEPEGEGSKGVYAICKVSLTQPFVSLKSRLLPPQKQLKTTLVQQGGGE